MKDLAYIKGHREKVGSIGPPQIRSPDLSEHRRQLRTLERQQLRNKSAERRRSTEENAAATEKAARKVVEDFLADDEDEFLPETDTEPLALSVSGKNPSRNSDDIPNIALASVRYGIGLRPTAAIATAALIDAGIITEDNVCKVIDKSKVMRAQEKLMRELREEFEEKCRAEGGVTCILFDG